MKMLEAIVIHRPSRWFIKDSPTKKPVNPHYEDLRDIDSATILYEISISR